MKDVDTHRHQQTAAKRTRLSSEEQEPFPHAAARPVELVMLRITFSYASAPPVTATPLAGTPPRRRTPIGLDFTEAAHIDTFPPPFRVKKLIMNPEHGRLTGVPWPG